MPSLLMLAAATPQVPAIQDGLYWIPLIPILGALINGLLGTRMSRTNVALIACGTILASLGAACICFYELSSFGAGPRVEALYQHVWTWFSIPGSGVARDFTISLAFTVDRLSGILLLIITGVGFLIHVYSIGYMSEDPGFARYFAYLNLFVGMMLTLVMGANLVVMFVGWEGVGLCSYLLIGFWFDDDQKASAGRKAFVVNRIGDFGFILGIFSLISLFGTVDLYTGNGEAPLASRVQAEIAAGHRIPTPGLAAEDAPAPLDRVQVAASNTAFGGWTYGAGITLACLLLFLGACGKSAQIPLYVWLPDAMAGPTPVSALIHAATMVTAGVYMMCRLSFLFVQAPYAMVVIASVGAATALLAALIATAQDDIKKVLAYSTVSQLGYMVLGVGVGGYWAASLHLFTHAFFKACLFLGAGSVMHGMANETNIWKFGGLRKEMPITAWTFGISTLAITGALPLSGFFSKDAILDLALHSHLPGGATTGAILWGVGTIAAFCTAFYMFRIYFLTFEGERRGLKEHHAHESMLMCVPLVVLAFMAVVATIWAVPVHEGRTLWQEFLERNFASANEVLRGRAGGEAEGLPWLWWGVAFVVAWAGTGLSITRYLRRAPTDLAAEQPVGGFFEQLARNKFYVDEIYDRVIVVPIREGATLIWNVVDQLLIDTILVRGWGILVSWFSDAFRMFQNGNAQRYAAVMGITLVLILLASGWLAPLFHSFGIGL